MAIYTLKSNILVYFPT